jgi:hypothetical protein
MRHLSPLNVLGLSAIVVACGSDPQGPAIEPADTAQTRGILLTSGEWVFHGGPLVWVPGTELVAFPSPDTGGCAIKTVHAGSGGTSVIDGDCLSIRSLMLWGRERYFRSLVAAWEGNALYYSVGIGGSLYADWVLRVADLVGGGTSTLHSGVAPALAVSPDGQHLGFDRSDSPIVRHLSSGAETHYGDYGQQEGSGGPITFSPDGNELLYGKWVPLELTLRRLSLDDRTSEQVSLPFSWSDARLLHWGASGIEVLAETSGYHVHNLTTGGQSRSVRFSADSGSPTTNTPSAGERHGRSMEPAWPIRSCASGTDDGRSGMPCSLPTPGRAAGSAWRTRASEPVPPYSPQTAHGSCTTAPPLSTPTGTSTSLKCREQRDAGFPSGGPECRPYGDSSGSRIEV